MHQLGAVLSACNLNPRYLRFVSPFIRAWKKLFPEIDVIVVIIGDEIPAELASLRSHLRLFAPIAGISTAFTAQFIRLLYPALLTEVKGSILISDIDMIPLNRSYYIKNIDAYSEEKFLVYRDVCGPEQYAICYNLATAEVWAAVFGVRREHDVHKRLLEAHEGYDDVKGSTSWYKDQIILRQCLQLHDPIILNDKEQGFQRLDRSFIGYIKTHLPAYIQGIKAGHYSDFHLPDYEDHRDLIEEIIAAL